MKTFCFLILIFTAWIAVIALISGDLFLTAYYGSVAYLLNRLLTSDPIE